MEGGQEGVELELDAGVLARGESALSNGARRALPLKPTGRQALSVVYPDPALIRWIMDISNSVHLLARRYKYTIRFLLSTTTAIVFVLPNRKPNIILCKLPKSIPVLLTYSGSQ
ncbi:hypothetical protein G7046_g9867 [Stylonectria norvegica]|nr:hypothetical protein G7046_g9867 [Stylonectria norvegica]